jgi:hypothetical protein
MLEKLFRRKRERSAGGMPATEDTRPCPHCRQPISRGATVCLHCERDVTAVMNRGQFIQIFGAPEAPSRVDHEPDQEPSSLD